MIIFNLQEQKLQDYFKALIGKNKIEKGFQLTESQIFLSNCRVNKTRVQEIILPIIDKIIKEIEIGLKTSN